MFASVIAASTNFCRTREASTPAYSDKTVGSTERSYRPFGLYRFVLAILVMSQHVGVVHDQASGLYRHALGTIATAAFFSLSGFIIVEAAEVFYVGRAQNFLLNRLIRIVPVYWCGLAITYAVTAFLLKDRMGAISSLPDLLGNLLGFLPGTSHSSHIVFVSWALRVEFIFYFLMTLIIYGSAVSKLGSYVLITALSCSLLAFYALSGYNHLEISKFEYTPFFVFGGACFWYARYPTLIKGCFVLLLLVLCGWTGLHLVMPENFPNVHFSIAEDWEHAIVLIVLLLLQPILGMVRSPAMMQLDRYFGKLSYPIYINHSWVILLAQAFLPMGLASVLCVVMLTIMVAMGFERYLESGFEALRDRIRGQRIGEPLTSGEKPRTHFAPSNSN